MQGCIDSDNTESSQFQGSLAYVRKECNEAFTVADNFRMCNGQPLTVAPVKHGSPRFVSRDRG